MTITQVFYCIKTQKYLNFPVDYREIFTLNVKNGKNNYKKLKINRSMEKGIAFDILMNYN
jgi:hypothetical protein